MIELVETDIRNNFAPGNILKRWWQPKEGLTYRVNSLQSILAVGTIEDAHAPTQNTYMYSGAAGGSL